MTRERKFSFVAVSDRSESRGDTSSRVSITKNGQMLFLGHDSRRFDRMFIKLYVDVSKPVLAWRLVSQLENDAMKNNWRLLKMGKTKILQTGVGRALKKLGLNGRTFRQLPIKEHQDTSLMDGSKYYYVELNGAGSDVQE